MFSRQPRVVYARTMDTAERSLLATLAYYGALRWPLTVVELSERLIPSRRFGQTAAVTGIGSIASLIQQLQASGRIRADSGLYVFGDVPADMPRHRIQRHTQSAEKWRHMLASAWWLQAVPYVRMLAAGGSLAMGSSSPQSDWDMFVIVKSGRLYTARLGLLLVALLLGRLRTKRMRIAPDKFCFNHLITTDGLAIRHRSLFTAHALAWLIPFHDPWAYAFRFRQANAWVGEYTTGTSGTTFVRRALSRSGLLNAIRWSGERILNTYFGLIVERLLCRWMRGRIEREPATHLSGGRIVADDREIEFHPRSFEAVALARYNAALTRLGMGQYAEHDSGLAH